MAINKKTKRKLKGIRGDCRRMGSFLQFSTGMIHAWVDDAGLSEKAQLIMQFTSPNEASKAKRERQSSTVFLNSKECLELAYALKGLADRIEVLDLARR